MTHRWFAFLLGVAFALGKGVNPRWESHILDANSTASGGDQDEWVGKDPNFLPSVKCVFVLGLKGSSALSGVKVCRFPQRGRPLVNGKPLSYQAISLHSSPPTSARPSPLSFCPHLAPRIPITQEEINTLGLSDRAEYVLQEADPNGKAAGCFAGHVKMWNQALDRVRVKGAGRVG